MHPIYKLTADNQDFTVLAQQRLVSLSITHESSDRVDTCSITLDNSEPHLELPRIGAQLGVQIGYQHTGFTDEPLTFTIDELNYFGPPFSLTIRARSVNLLMAIKEKRTRTWDNTTFKKILETIAYEHNYEPVVPDELEDFPIEHYHQTASDLRTIRDILIEFGRNAYLVQVIQNRLVVYRADTLVSVKSKKPLPRIKITPDNIIRYRMISAERGKYHRVIAKWYDTDNAQERQVYAGSDNNPTYEISRLFDNAQQAIKAAQSQLLSLQRGTSTLRATLLGNPILRAQTPLEISGLPPSVNGEWIISSVTHKIDSAGYVCELTANTIK